MNTRSKTKDLDLANPVEFPSLPPRSRNPLTVLPPMTTTPPVAEFTLLPAMMDQASNVTASGNNPTLQPTTSSLTMFPEPVSGPEVTSIRNVRTPDPKVSERGGTSSSSVINGSVGDRIGGSKSHSSYHGSSRYSSFSRRGGKSDGAGSSQETMIQAKAAEASAKAEANARAKAAQAKQQCIREFQEKQLEIKRKEMELG